MSVQFASEDKFDGITFMVTSCPHTIQENLKITPSELMKNVNAVVKEAQARKMLTRAYLAFPMGSEHNPNIDPMSVNDMAQQLNEMNVDEIVLQDSIAAGTLEKLDTLLNTLKIPKSKLGVHFHDSKYLGLDMILLALSKGITTIDCAVAGLGQCYINKTALGNMVTEELLFVLDCMGIEHGVNWVKLLDTGDFISEELTRENCTDAYDVDFKEDMPEYKKKYADLIKSL